MQEYEALRLENQLCFPLYAASRRVVGLYKPHLDAIGLTYTQYIAMMVLWEEGPVSVKTLGERLYLDSGTLTPLLKKMESAGWIARRRDPNDERSVIVTVTGEGMQLRDAARDIPARMGACIGLSAEEAGTLYTLLYKLLGQLEA